MIPEDKGKDVILVLVLNLCIKRDRNGVTAYQLAKSRNYSGILKLFAKSKTTYNFAQDLKIQLNLLRSTQK